MLARDDALRDRELWCLVPTEALGYWSIQSKSQVSKAENVVVIGADGAPRARHGGSSR